MVIINVIKNRDTNEFSLHLWKCVKVWTLSKELSEPVSSAQLYYNVKYCLVQLFILFKLSHNAWFKLLMSIIPFLFTNGHKRIVYKLCKYNEGNLKLSTIRRESILFSNSYSIEVNSLCFAYPLLTSSLNEDVHFRNQPNYSNLSPLHCLKNWKMLPLELWNWLSLTPQPNSKVCLTFRSHPLYVNRVIAQLPTVFSFLLAPGNKNFQHRSAWIISIDFIMPIACMKRYGMVFSSTIK